MIYDSLNVEVWDSDRLVIRALRARLTPHQRTRHCRDVRHMLIRMVLARHRREQHTALPLAAE